MLQANMLEYLTRKLHLFSNCVPVKGYARGIISDLQFSDVKFVPVELINLVENFEGIQIDEIVKHYPINEIDTIKSYISHLVELGVINFATELSNFPKMNFEYKVPCFITNIIFDFKENQYDSEQIILTTESLNCQNVCFNFFSESTLMGFYLEIEQFENSIINHIEIATNVFIEEEKIELMFKECRVHSVTTRSPFQKVLYEKTHDNLSKKTTNAPFTAVNNYLINNLLMYAESQAHHTYFNRKLYFGPNGEIKNAPECPETFGYIQDLESPEQLKTIVQTSEFQKYWFVHKEITDVCKDCEFRHMCVDNRLPHQRSENEWFHQTECNYNPYIAKWQGEEGYRTLAECGVISNENGFSIDHEKIAEINKELWGEDED